MFLQGYMNTTMNTYFAVQQCHHIFMLQQCELLKFNGKKSARYKKHNSLQADGHLQNKSSIPYIIFFSQPFVDLLASIVTTWLVIVNHFVEVMITFVRGFKP